MQDFRNIKVWEKGHAFTLEVYKRTQTFPADERFGLTSQLRRSSSSIPSNLAEGCARAGDVEFARFANIALGSTSEADCQLLLARDLGYLDSAAYGQLFNQVTEVKRMLNAFERSLRGL
ncbi:MAG TPA: four helix bundle protein [Lacipirellula sp.]